MDDDSDDATARLVYLTYFHGVMSYGIILWGQKVDIHAIVVLQKRAIRAFYEIKPLDSLVSVLKKSILSQ